MAARINLTRTAWLNFQNCFPTQKDMDAVKRELARVGQKPERGKPIPFSPTLKNFRVTWAEADKKWYIVYRGNPDIDVVVIDKA